MGQLSSPSILQAEPAWITSGVGAGNVGEMWDRQCGVWVSRQNRYIESEGVVTRILTSDLSQRRTQRWIVSES